MTRDEVKEFFKTSLGIEEPTEEQITAFLNKHHEELNEQKILADKSKSLSDELAKAKAELDELKNNGLSEQEKLLAEMKKAQEDAKARENDYLLKSNRLEVEKILVAGGLKETDYATILDSIVGTDLDKSKELATNLVNAFSEKIKVAVADKEKELLENTGKPNGGSGSGSTLSAQEEIAKNLVGNSNDENAKSSEEIIKAYS